jgi:hypothetical protein
LITGSPPRIAAPGRPPPLEAGKAGERDDAGSQASPGPGGPALLAAERQRGDKQGHRRGEQAHSRQVQPGLPAVLARQQHRRARQRRDAHRHVDPEDRPPARAERVRRDERPAERLADDGAAGHGHHQDAERPRPGPPVEAHLDPGEDLRDHDRGARALGDPRADEHPGSRREAAGERGEGEPGQAGQVHPPVAGDAAQPRAGDDQHREREDVPGYDELERAARGVQVPVDGRGGHVDDRDVDVGHELAGHQHGQQPSLAQPCRHESLPSKPGF